MRSTRWWIKNKLFISASNNFIIISIFVFGFGNPRANMIGIFVVHGLYTVYIIMLVPWIKLRYKIINVIGSCVFLGIMICLYGMTSCLQSQNNDCLYKFSGTYIALIIGLCCLLIFGYIVEILAQKIKIQRQLKSIFRRFILCKELDK